MSLETDVIEGTITGWAFGGAGITRSRGLAIFIPDTCPGDVVEARITRRHARHAEAELTRVTVPSVDRVEPRCSVYGICGGCQAQNISYEAQLRLKRQVVVDALERVGGFSSPDVALTRAADPSWGYRRHVTFQVRDGKMGFVARDNHSLVTPLSCLLFTDDPALYATLNDLARGSPSARARVVREGARYWVRWETESPSSEEWRKDLSSREMFVGGEIVYGDETVSFGVSRMTFFHEGRELSLEIGAFSQNHASQSALVYQDMIQYVVEAQARRVLDLYGGVGVLATALAARGVEVELIESDPRATRSAKGNLKKYAKAPYRVREARVERALPSVKGKFDLVVVNPPRVGVNPLALQALARIRPKRILYLSCSPATLARDLKALSSWYTLTSCQPYDMFPQTAHVETLVVLDLLPSPNRLPPRGPPQTRRILA